VTLFTSKQSNQKGGEGVENEATSGKKNGRWVLKSRREEPSRWRRNGAKKPVSKLGEPKSKGGGEKMGEQRREKKRDRGRLPIKKLVGEIIGRESEKQGAESFERTEKA